MKIIRYNIIASSNAKTSLDLNPQGKGLSFVGSIKTSWIQDDNDGNGFTWKQGNAAIDKMPVIEGVSYSLREME